MQAAPGHQDELFPASVPSQAVLGTPLLLTDYSGLGEACQRWTRRPAPVAVEFANTQVVIMRRHDPSFHRLTQACDYFAPDGMPLVWCLNRAGAGLRDRVYGPTFMRQFLDAVPATFTHYLLGGSAECGRRLKERFSQANPGLRFIGEYHGRCEADGRLDPAQEAAVIEGINRLSPDFIWIGFGTPKQQAWVHRYKPQIKRGVILSVGFGFDVNAGMKPDQPLWMQRLGLGWLFRLWSEPGRLLGRYLKYNSLFLWYLFRDGIRSRSVETLES
ncbi:MAG: WecB/TagA/CpsF family glycosyltransferase [Verrucomicrobia bacterium]|nr:WecB/TagA/CpsF family glycosyltransferase [Verrucomicrobiota bacterium]